MAAGAWDHTAGIMAAIANANRGKNDSPVSPAKLNPFRRAMKSQRKSEPAITNRNFDILKTVFMDQKRSET